VRPGRRAGRAALELLDVDVVQDIGVVRDRRARVSGMRQERVIGVRGGLGEDVAADRCPGVG
jgi:hypothetical protein